VRSVAFVRRRLVLIVVLTFATLPFAHLGLLLGDGRRRAGRGLLHRADVVRPPVCRGAPPVSREPVTR
jgi:hypothetical protein